MSSMVLGGDLGGTKINLGLYEREPSGGLSLIREDTCSSRDYRGLEDAAAAFLASTGAKVQAAVFGVAGPVFEGRVQTTNLPWIVEESALRQALACPNVRLINDLEAMAYGASFLSDSDQCILQAGTKKEGHCAVIAAGTGLGQAYLFWDGHHYRPAASEGGHADFAPRNEMEWGLLLYLQRQHGRVSYERVLSGPGLQCIFRYLREIHHRNVSPELLKAMEVCDPGKVIGEAAVAGTCPTCVEAVDLFLGIYGAQAGNLALTLLAVGGTYVGGGMIVKLLPRVTAGCFLEGFLDKGRFRRLMGEMPLHILLNPRTSQIGAAHTAASLLQ